MTTKRVVVVGGGLAGIGAALTLARHGYKRVVIIEKNTELGGLAGTFQEDNRFYPLAYHHILSGDRTLREFLQDIGALKDVRWRRIQMLVERERRLYDLGSIRGFASFPLGAFDKLRFLRLMLRSYRKKDWSDWEGRSAAELLDSWASPAVRQALFDPLTILKFNLPCDRVSAAWLGARLHFREGVAPLGYMPGRNWTQVLCNGLTAQLEQAGVEVRMSSQVRALRGEDRTIVEVELDTGERLPSDVVVSAIPLNVYHRFVPTDETPGIASIRYTSIVSMTCTTTQRIEPEFYWLNLSSLRHRASGLFVLSSLNPTIGAPGETCLNFVTHLPGPDHEFFRASDDEIAEAYLSDFRQIFGTDLAIRWRFVARLPLYSPVFGREFRNVPVKSVSWQNVYFAGNYRTFPSVASTGTALASGVEAAQAIIGDRTVAAGR